MRITHISTDFLPFIGGVTQHIVEITRALATLGHQVEIIAPHRSDSFGELWNPPFQERLGKVDIWRVPFVVNRSVRFITGQISSRMSDRRFCDAMIQRLKETRPELVHWHAIDSRHNPMTRWTSSARVWTNHTSNFIMGLESQRMRRLYEIEAAQADEIIGPSEELCDLTRDLGYPADRIHFISNGVDASRFSPEVSGAEWRNKLGLHPEDRLVLCPRRPEKKNGVSFALQAILELLEKGTPHLHFAVSGNFIGPRTESEEELLSEMVAGSRFADRIHLLGRVENVAMPGLYAAASLIVMPSLIEATSLSAMEGMATGKAIVSTDVGGLPFLVRDGVNGILVPARDSHALAEGLGKLLADPGLADEMGRQGRKRVEEELDWMAIARQVERVYDRALARFHGSVPSNIR